LKRLIVLFLAILLLGLSGCASETSVAGDELGVYLYVYNEDDEIEYVKAEPGVSYTPAHSTHVMENTGNWAVNASGGEYIFFYLSDKEGQLSWGDTTETDGGMVTLINNNISVGSYHISNGGGAVSVCPYIVDKNGEPSNIIGNKSILYIATYDEDPSKNHDMKANKCIAVTFEQVSEFGDEYAYTHAFKVTVSDSDKELTELF
jgi:hypothetical protein